MTPSPRLPRPARMGLLLAGLALLVPPATPAAALPSGPTLYSFTVNRLSGQSGPLQQELLDWTIAPEYLLYPPNTVSYGVEVDSAQPTAAVPLNDRSAVFVAPSQFDGGINSATGLNLYDGITYNGTRLNLTSGAVYWVRVLAWSDWDPVAKRVVPAHFISGWSNGSGFTSP